MQVDVSCSVCGAIIDVSGVDKTLEEVTAIANSIAELHCKKNKKGEIEQTRSWDYMKTVIKKPKVNMNEYQELA